MAGEQILVVEDQRAVAGALQMRLRGLGYDVMAVARDGPEAIEKADELNPDLILMDIKLGEGMDGIDAAHKIRQQHDIPVVFVSAYADQKLLERARQTKPAGFINKPFTTKDLLTTIDLALFLHNDEVSAGRVVDSGADESADKRGAVITTDLDGRVSFVTVAAERRIGLRRRQLVGRPITQYLMEWYGLDEVAAELTLHRVISEAAEENLVPPTAAAAAPGFAADTLGPLHDAHGQVFGAALRFSEDMKPRVGAAATKAHEMVMDAMPVGVVFSDENLNVHHLNARAREIIVHNRGLELKENRISARDKRLHAKLLELVRSAIDRTARGEDGRSDAMFIKAPMQQEQIELVVTPVAGAHAGAGATQILLYLFDSGIERDVSYEILTRLYGLTQTEAKLVQLLIRGLTLDEAAQDLEISVNTARTHLKHIFHKTGINRQTELVHRIETGPAGLLLDFTS